MVKLIFFAAILSSIPGDVAGVPGWFRNVPRGGMGYYHGIYPDALSNVVHGYAEVDKQTDEAIDVIHDVKLSTTKKDSPMTDEDYDEDPFFHALLNNYHDNNSVVNVSSESTSDGRVDVDMFEKLNEKIFHPHHDEASHKPTKKVSFGLREVFEESSFFE
ncbi:hypothetical protein ACHAXR_011653 [Thalassiosira sp. AJA248-18]